MPTHFDGTIVSTTVSGREVQFFVADKGDLIQGRHLAGEFYENEELAIISSRFPRGGVFVDIGANIGNHAIYVAKFLFPSQIILIEPNPPAIAILRVNIAINNLQGLVDLSHIGVGLSDVPGAATITLMPTNLGGARMSASNAPDAPLRLVRGDDILFGRRVDFVKIDVEGMELQVLNGLSKTLEKWRPVMFIEVEEAHSAEFLSWVAAHGYQVADRSRRYERIENYLIAPATASSI